MGVLGLRGLHSQVFDGNNMNFFAEMLRPVSDGPFAKAPDLERATDIVALQGVARQERIVRQLSEYAEEFLPVPFRSCREHVQDSVVHGVFVGRYHRPSAESRSCNCCSSLS